MVASPSNGLAGVSEAVTARGFGRVSSLSTRIALRKEGFSRCIGSGVRALSRVTSRRVVVRVFLHARNAGVPTGSGGVESVAINVVGPKGATASIAAAITAKKAVAVAGAPSEIVVTARVIAHKTLASSCRWVGPRVG